MRPFIGVTCSADPDGEPTVNPRYVRALNRQGALPVALPFLAGVDAAHALLDRLDGVLLTGSEDMDPALWHEELHPATVLMHPNRMTTELDLCRALLSRDLPTLGICGGMQNLNVAAGGSIHQHIPDLGEMSQHSDPSFVTRHPVEAAADSRLGALLGAAFETNTEHHQACNRLGDGLAASAWCSDGLVEGLEATDKRFLLGVQWHPELMPDDAAQVRLIAALVDAARSTVRGTARGAARSTTHNAELGG